MIEEYVEKFGEEYKDIIEDALKWLDENELETHFPINREKYLADIIRRIKLLKEVFE